MTGREALPSQRVEIYHPLRECIHFGKFHFVRESTIYYSNRIEMSVKTVIQL